MGMNFEAVNDLRKSIDSLLNEGKVNCFVCSKQEMEVMLEALNAVKLLEPAEPIYVTNPYTNLPVSYCPRCRESIRMFRYGEAYKESKYCTFCGQAVKWE